MKLISIIITLLACLAASSVYAVSPASADATNPLPTIDPQARQILAAMVNTYSDMEEYSDEESIGSMGDTSPSFPHQINSHFTVALKRGSGILLTSSDPGGAIVTVHGFPESTDLLNQHFLVFTTDTRYPGLYMKETVSEYQEALAHSCRQVGLGTSGAAALFSKGDISSLLLEPAFNGLQLGEPLSVVNVMCDRVTVNIGSDSETNSLIFYIGQKDHLLRQLSIIHNQGPHQTYITESFYPNHTISTLLFPSSFPSTYFQYTPPKGFRSVSSFPAPVGSAVKPSVTPDKTHNIVK